MKKLMIYLGIIVALFALLFIVNQQSEKSKNEARIGNLDAATKAKAQELYGVDASKLKAETVQQLNDANYQNIITPEDLKKKIATKEETFVYFFSTTCVHCQATTPILNPIAKDAAVDLKQLNLWEHEAEWNTYKITATPTLVVFRDGKEVSRLEGGVSHDGQQGLAPDAFKQFFTTNKKK
ncbi:MAG: thioredoxin [Paenibacillus sp.]|jgi:thiol-disulfide isomerase/thioredoxin|nr:thioredoxin [Paenibacillus sp.]